EDVALVRDRCAALGIPCSFEWVVDTCPSLGPAAAAAGLTVVEHPLLVLERDDFRPAKSDAHCEIIPATDDAVRQARAVANLGFAPRGPAVGQAGRADRAAAAAETSAELVAPLVDRAERGVTVTAAAYTDDGMVASGSHQPVDKATEIVGVAT